MKSRKMMKKSMKNRKSIPNLLKQVLMILTILMIPLHPLNRGQDRDQEEKAEGKKSQEVGRKEGGVVAVETRKERAIDQKRIGKTEKDHTRDEKGASLEEKRKIGSTDIDDLLD